MTAIACPRCGTGLSSVQSRSATLLGCSGCGGIWLDNHAARRVVDALCSDTVDRADAISRFAQRATDRAAALSCPSCAKPLARWTVPEANVDVDWCEHHGTWFDKDELATVSRTYAARRAYGGGAAVAAGAVAAGAVGAGAVAAGAVIASDPSMRERAQNAINENSELVLEGGGAALELVDVADVADGAGVVAEGAGEALGFLGDILGAIDF
jgi:Zn-finger nucleic acid-binding protein